MRVGCYSLDLYCKRWVDIHLTPDCYRQYTGRTESECLRKAKADGWVLVRAGGQKVEICPKHRTNKNRAWNYKGGSNGREI